MKTLPLSFLEEFIKSEGKHREKGVAGLVLFRDTVKRKKQGNPAPKKKGK